MLGLSTGMKPGHKKRFPVLLKQEKDKAQRKEEEEEENRKQEKDKADEIKRREEKRKRREEEEQEEDLDDERRLARARRQKEIEAEETSGTNEPVTSLHANNMTNTTYTPTSTIAPTAGGLSKEKEKAAVIPKPARIDRTDQHQSSGLPASKEFSAFISHKKEV